MTGIRLFMRQPSAGYVHANLESAGIEFINERVPRMRFQRVDQ